MLGDADQERDQGDDQGDQRKLIRAIDDGPTRRGELVERARFKVEVSGSLPSGVRLPCGMALSKGSTHPRMWQVFKAVSVSAVVFTALSITHTFPGCRTSATRCRESFRSVCRMACSRRRSESIRSPSLSCLSTFKSERLGVSMRYGPSAAPTLKAKRKQMVYAKGSLALKQQLEAARELAI
jgi:hypothetical protein